MRDVPTALARQLRDTRVENGAGRYNPLLVHWDLGRCSPTSGLETDWEKQPLRFRELRTVQWKRVEAEERDRRVC